MDPLFKRLGKLRTTLVISKLHEHDPKFDELIPFFEHNLEASQKIREKNAAIGSFPEDHFKFMDLLQFMHINTLDFLVAFQSYFNSKGKWSKNFFCRQLALIIYEFTDDIHHTINATLRKNQEIDRLDPDLKPKINSLVKKLSYIKQLKYDDHLKEIRNETAAHKEGDIQQLYEKIQKVDETLIIACATFISHWILELVDLLKDVPAKLEILRTKEASQGETKTSD